MRCIGLDLYLDRVAPPVNADYHNQSVKDYGATCGNGAKTRNIFRTGMLPSHHFILKGEKSLQKAC